MAIQDGLHDGAPAGKDAVVRTLEKVIVEETISYLSRSGSGGQYGVTTKK